MSQDIYSTINPASTSGTQLAALLDDLKEAIVSNLSGTSRPTELDAGGGWLDTTNEGSPNFYWVYNIYTGSVDVEVFRINLSTSKASISDSDSTFRITRISADTTGAILKLIKNRIASSGQVLSGDVVGDIQFVGKASDGSSPIVARMKAVATDDMTSSAQGTYLAFEASLDGGAVLSEMMRLVDKKLGIGLIAPTKDLHVKGSNGGIMAHRVTDDATGAVVSVRKGRISGDTAADSADNIGSYDFRSTDEGGVEQLVAQFLATALEDHASTALGTKLLLKTIAAGATSLTTRMTISDTIEAIARFDINALKLISQDIATSASIIALNADKAVVIFTGATATDVKSMASTGSSKVVYIHNRSSATVTIKHQYTSGTTAADRFKLPESVDIEILADSSAAFFYDATDTRWKVLSGSGSGGGGQFRTTTTQTVTSGGTIAMSLTAGREMIPVVGTGSVQTAASVTPFGSSAPKDGAEKMLVGTDDAGSVLITYEDSAKGCVGNFSTIELTKYSKATFVYNLALDRYILN